MYLNLVINTCIHSGAYAGGSLGILLVPMPVQKNIEKGSLF